MKLRSVIRQSAQHVLIISSLGVATFSHGQVTDDVCPAGMQRHTFEGNTWPASLATPPSIPSGPKPAVTATVPVPGSSGQTVNMTLTPRFPALAAPPDWTAAFGGQFFYGPSASNTFYGSGVRTAHSASVGAFMTTDLAFSVPVYNLRIRVADVDRPGTETIHVVAPAANWQIAPAPSASANATHYTITATSIRANSTLPGCQDWVSASCDVQLYYDATPLTAASYAHQDAASANDATAYLRQVSFCLPPPPPPAPVPALNPLTLLGLLMGMGTLGAAWLQRSRRNGAR